ncbi:MAG: hypothetical protein KC414_11470, partial [Romboutsia sp.]|nr:hypothetical protein [Romboutsia sp.]
MKTFLINLFFIICTFTVNSKDFDFFDFHHNVLWNYYNENYKTVIDEINSHQDSIITYNDVWQGIFFRLQMYSAIQLKDKDLLQDLINKHQALIDRYIGYDAIYLAEDFDKVADKKLKNTFNDSTQVIINETISDNGNYELAYYLLKLNRNKSFHRNNATWETTANMFDSTFVIDSLFINKIDKISTILTNKYLPKITKLIDEYGFPTAKNYGNIADIAWSVIHHSNDETIVKYYPTIEKLYTTYQISSIDFAYYYDRYSLIVNNVQYYGTQFVKDKATGKFIMSPVQLPDDLETINE